MRALASSTRAHDENGIPDSTSNGSTEPLSPVKSIRKSEPLCGPWGAKNNALQDNQRFDPNSMRSKGPMQTTHCKILSGLILTA